MWIRDALPSRFPGVRFIIYGYDTALSGSKSFQVVPDIAGSLISELKANGWAAPAAKPIIFLAHSLGGVVLKQSMVMLAGSGVRERQIIRNIKGTIFFGVPTVGMAVPDIYEMLEDQPNTALLDYLSNRSNYIPTLEKQFDGISYTRDMVLFWAYETQATPSLSVRILLLIAMTSLNIFHRILVEVGSDPAQTRSWSHRSLPLAAGMESPRSASSR
jgi:hypothetical protein